MMTQAELDRLMKPILARHGSIAFRIALDYVNLSRAVCIGMEKMPAEVHSNMHDTIDYAWSLVLKDNKVSVAQMRSVQAEIVQVYETFDILADIGMCERRAEHIVTLPPAAFGKLS